MEGGRARLFFRTVDIAFKMIGTLEVVVTGSAATPGRSLLEQFLLLAYQPVGGCLEYFVIMAIRTIRRLVYGAFYVFSLSCRLALCACIWYARQASVLPRP